MSFPLLSGRASSLHIPISPGSRYTTLSRPTKLGQLLKYDICIVSNTNEPTQRLSWLLTNALKLMPKDVPTHLENSLELIKCIQAGDSIINKKTRAKGLLNLTK